MQDFGNLLTVADMCRFVESKVQVDGLIRRWQVATMRWFWIDRFLEFESGRYAKAVKNVSLAEDYLHDHFPQLSRVPNSLVIEGLAQTGGLLVCEHNQFTEKVILAKIPKVRVLLRGAARRHAHLHGHDRVHQGGRGRGQRHQPHGRACCRPRRRSSSPT